VAWDTILAVELAIGAFLSMLLYAMRLCDRHDE
jgi:hypothetical protein